MCVCLSVEVLGGLEDVILAALFFFVVHKVMDSTHHLGCEQPQCTRLQWDKDLVYGGFDGITILCIHCDNTCVCCLPLVKV